MDSEDWLEALQSTKTIKDDSLKEPLVLPPRLKTAASLPAIVFALSVAAHGLVLVAPMPEPSESLSLASSPQEEPDDLAVVVLSQTAAPEEAAVEPPQATPPQPVSPQSAPQPAAIAPPPEAAPQTDVIPNKPVPESEPASPEPAPPVPPEAPPAPPEGALPPTPPEPDFEPEYGDPVPPTGPGPLVSYSDTFPHLDGAVAGCFGFSECRRVSGAGSYRSVARSLIADLEAQGYTIDLRDDLEDTGRNVYELTSPDETTVKYLLVFSDFDGSAVYVMSDEIMTLSDLQALQAQTEPNRHSG